MARQKPDDLRDPDRKPDRLLSKEEGLRQILHAAIRMTLASEDAYATHLLVRSADTVLADLHKRKNISDPLDFLAYLDPQYRQSFHAIHNETYNFLKHGHLSHDGTIPIHSIVLSNDILLWMAVSRFNNLFSYLTHHMDLYSRVILAIHPHFVKWDSSQEADQFIELRRQAEHLTRGEILSAAEFSCRSDPPFQLEKKADLVDVDQANETKMKRLEGGDLTNSQS